MPYLKTGTPWATLNISKLMKHVDGLISRNSVPLQMLGEEGPKKPLFLCRFGESVTTVIILLFLLTWGTDQCSMKPQFILTVVILWVIYSKPFEKWVKLVNWFKKEVDMAWDKVYVSLLLHTYPLACGSYYLEINMAYRKLDCIDLLQSFSQFRKA